MNSGRKNKEESKSFLSRVLDIVPRALSSRTHILFLFALLIVLVILPVTHIFIPSASYMLIGGNWTNVTSDMGACIAAGGTVHLLNQGKKRNKLAEASHKIMADLYKHHTGKDHPEAIDIPVNED